MQALQQLASLQPPQSVSVLDANFALAAGQYGQANVATIATLRANTLTAGSLPTTIVWVQGYAATGDGGGGIFMLAAGDTTTADDGGMVIKDAAGNRWKRPIPFDGLIPTAYYGAVPNADNTTAIQGAINYARTNFGYQIATGLKNVCGIKLTAGKSIVSTSLDCTSLGTIVGFYIWGESQLGSYISGQLTVPGPVLDGSGMWQLHLRNFMIRVDSGNATCCFMNAKPAVAPLGSNHSTDMDGCFFEISTTSGTAIAAAVIQNSDQSLFRNTVFDGELVAPGLSAGARLPLLYRGTVSSVTANSPVTGQSTIVFNTDASAPTSVAANLPVRVCNGYTGAGQVAAVDSASKVANVLTVVVNKAFTTVAANAAVEISALGSPFQLVPSGDLDVTYYNFDNCVLTGTVGASLTGSFGCYTFIGCYFGGQGALTADKSAITVTSMDSAEAPGTTTIQGICSRTENQANPVSTEFYAIKTYLGRTSVYWSGQLEILDQNSDNPTGAVFTVGGAGTYENITWWGSANPGPSALPLAKGFTSCSSLQGSAFCWSPGSLTSVGMFDFDWKLHNNTTINGLWHALADTAGFAMAGDGPRIGFGKVAASSIDLTTNTVRMPFTIPNGEVSTIYTGGSGTQITRSYKVPGNALLNTNAASGSPKTIAFNVVLLATQTITSTGLQLRQGGTTASLLASTSAGPAASANDVLEVTINLMNNSNSATTGTSTVASSKFEAAAEASTVKFCKTTGTLSSFDLTQDMWIDVMVNSANGNPLTGSTIKMHGL